MESLAFLSRIPDQTVIDGNPGRGVNHARATRDADGSYALVYLPSGQTITVNMHKVRGSQAKTLWFNPRDGSMDPIGTVDTRGTHRFDPPTSGEGQDWVLMILSEEN